MQGAAFATKYAVEEPAEDAPAIDVESGVFEQPSTPEAGPLVRVDSIELTGLAALSPTDFSDILGEYSGRELSTQELQALAGAIAVRIRGHGYPFGTSGIERQSVRNGVLRVWADEGRIDEIRLRGNAPASVRKALQKLVTGRPARLGEVESLLLCADEVAGVTTGDVRFLRESGRGILSVKVEHRRVTALASVTTSGNRAIGPVIARLDLHVNGLLDSQDALLLTWSGTPAQSGELQAGHARYARRIGSNGAEIALIGSWARARQGGAYADYGLLTRSHKLGLDLTVPVLRRRDLGLSLFGELELSGIRQWRMQQLLQADRLVTARVGLRGHGRMAGGYWNGSLALAQGLPVFDASTGDDPLRSRQDADGVYTLLEGWASWHGTLAGRTSLMLAVHGQLSSDPLLLGEEFGIGGQGSVRGYDWGEQQGDSGIAGTAELRHRFDLGPGAPGPLVAYAFVDGGLVDHLGDDQAARSLWSTGGGFRLELTPRTGLSVEIARPLGPPRRESADNSPKLNLGLVQSFR